MTISIAKPGASAYEELDVSVVTKTTTYLVTTNDHVILCDATSGAFTVTLPALADVPNDKIFHIKKIDSTGNAVTVSQGG